MDTKNSYKTSSQYFAYCKNTDEKAKLQEQIKLAFAPKLKKILDLGCGNGINTAFLADYFKNASIEAIERSSAQIELARNQNNRPNINYLQTSFEDFKTDDKYNFILASHVLQYIDSDLEKFVKKAISLLAFNGELWFVQQTRKGMAQIISHQKPYLTNPRFNNWTTFEDYLPLIKKAVTDDFRLEVSYLNSSIKEINFPQPTDEDKLRLEFIFCLNNSFDEQSKEFKKNLASLNLNDSGRISHPNGIIKIRRLK